MNLSHNIDYIRFITGLEIKRVYAEYDTFATPVEVEDFLVATILYNNNAVGWVEASSCVKGGDGFDRIYGTEGQIILSSPLKVYTTKEINGLKANKWQEIDVKEDKEPRVKYIEDFCQRIAKNKEPFIFGEDGYKCLEVVLAAYQSKIVSRVIEI